MKSAGAGEPSVDLRASSLESYKYGGQSGWVCFRRFTSGDDRVLTKLARARVRPGYCPVRTGETRGIVYYSSSKNYNARRRGHAVATPLLNVQMRSDILL